MPESDNLKPSLADLAAEANRRRGRHEGTAVDNHRCDNHDAAVRTLAGKVEGMAKDLHADELRIERLRADMENLLERIPEHLGASIATLSGQVTTVGRDLDEVKRMLRSDFVTRAELDPIRRIVYGVAGLILSGVFGALVWLVILK